LVAAWVSVAAADAFPQLLEPLPWPSGEGGTAAAETETEAVMALLPSGESSERWVPAPPASPLSSKGQAGAAQVALASVAPAAAALEMAPVH